MYIKSARFRICKGKNILGSLKMLSSPCFRYLWTKVHLNTDASGKTFK